MISFVVFVIGIAYLLYFYSLLPPVKIMKLSTLPANRLLPYWSLLVLGFLSFSGSIILVLLAISFLHFYVKPKFILEP